MRGEGEIKKKKANAWNAWTPERGKLTMQRGKWNSGCKQKAIQGMDGRNFNS